MGGCTAGHAIVQFIASGHFARLCILYGMWEVMDWRVFGKCKSMFNFANASVASSFWLALMFSTFGRVVAFCKDFAMELLYRIAEKNMFISLIIFYKKVTFI